MKTNILAKLLVPEASGKWQTPVGANFLFRAVSGLQPLFLKLSELESRQLRAKLKNIKIIRPVYICGIARSGTTITLEMFHQHPDAGNHFYYHMPVPFLPHWWECLISSLPVPVFQPVERIHKDGLMVTRDSPDAVEEMLWMAFFNGLHDENCSNILGSEVRNERFEAFYKEHIQKLLWNQNKKRYITKNNYNVTRLEYIARLFPDAVFLLVIRNPINHIASLMKQHRLFTEMTQKDSYLHKTLGIIGHFEFGPNLAFINPGNTETIHRIRRLFAEGRHVRGWAVYWEAIYRFIAERLEQNSALKKAGLVVRYEDLCRNPSETIDRIIQHIGFSADKFKEVKKQYVARLAEPRYYRPDFSDVELADIQEITGETAKRFGYDLAAAAASGHMPVNSL
ncbi:MAG: sulfotransferase [Desulfobacterales bacterium]